VANPNPKKRGRKFMEHELEKSWELQFQSALAVLYYIY
jgi:hypothetical protein